MKKWLMLISVVVIITGIWMISEKSDAYANPQEALFANDNELLLIPGYKLNDKALFFFIKNTNDFGTAYVEKGLFGWKVDYLTWSPMDNEREYEKLSGYQGHGEHLIYGLIKHGNERMIEIGEADATILDLGTMLSPEEVEAFNLEDLSIWYLESELSLYGEQIRLLDENDGEEIDTYGI